MTSVPLHPVASGDPVDAAPDHPFLPHRGMSVDKKRARDVAENPIPHILTHSASTTPTYRVYKRRYFGLAQLILLNLVVSWCWLTFAASSTTTSRYFHTTESAVNWLSTAFLFAFVMACPVTLYTLNRGPKLSMVISSGLLLVGAWLRYAASRARYKGQDGVFGLLVFGQLLIGFAQPFVLVAPTRYSHLWFSEEGRITATALTTLANPLGGALGQLIGPIIATAPSDIPQLVLVVAIITTVACVPTVFIPSAPPSPPSATATINSNALSWSSTKFILSKPTYHLLAWPFIIYVSAFNATSSLLNQILQPHGYSEDEAGIVGAVLIATGIVAAALSSPILDRWSRLRLPVVKLCVALIASMYLAFIFVPSSGTMVGICIVSAIVGAASFIILPLALEMMVNVCLPVGPEVSSTLAWAVSQLGGGIFIIIMNALKAGPTADPPWNMHRSLVFQAVLAWVVLPLPMVLGYFGLKLET